MPCDGFAFSFEPVNGELEYTQVNGLFFTSLSLISILFLQKLIHFEYKLDFHKKNEII